jgi:hypothetical protein
MEPSLGESTAISKKIVEVLWFPKGNKSQVRKLICKWFGTYKV